MSSSTFLLRRLAPAFLVCSPFARAQAPASSDVLAKLVPEGTVVYVQVPSLDRLDASIRKVMTAFHPEAAQEFKIDAMLAEMQLPGSAKEIDHARPLAFCLVLPAAPDAEPSPAFLVPVASPDAFVRSITESGAPMTTAVESGYVLVSMSPDAKHGAAPASIALGLPAGEVAARVDLKRLVDHFRPMIDMGLTQMEMMMAAMPPEATGGMQVAPLMKMYVGGLRAIIDSGETLDLAVRLDGNRMELASSLTAKEKSVLAEFASKEKTDAKMLARFLDPASPMGFVVGMDSASMVKRMKPLIETSLSIYPEPIRSDFQKMMVSSDEFAALMGSAMCCAGGLGEDGMRMSVYLHPKDPEKLTATYVTMLKSMPTLSVTEPKTESVDGQAVTRMRIQIDAKAFADALAKTGKGAGNDATGAEMTKMLEKLYGKDGLAFSIATKGDVTVVVAGGDEAFQRSALARVSAAGKAPAGVARGLEQVGDLNPCFLMHYDIGKMMHGIQGLMGPAMAQSGLTFPDLSASLTSWLGVDGRTWKGAMSVDVNELGAFATAMKSAVGAAKDGSAPQPAKKGDK